MICPRFFSRPSRQSLLVLVGFLCACSSQKTAQHPDEEDTWVPQSTQRKSERMMADQQSGMEELNMTPAERGASQHRRKMDRLHDRQNEEE